MDEYIRIPGTLIRSKSMSDKRVAAYVSIYFSGWSGKNIDFLLKYSGYSIDRHNGKVKDQYICLVNQLVERGYYSRGMVYIEQECGFGLVYYREFEKILNYRTRQLSNGKMINHANILLVLAHIRQHIYKDCSKPRFYSNLLSRISDEIGLSVRCISNSIEVLETLKIVHSETLPRYQGKDKLWHSNVTIFVDYNVGDSYDWRTEVAKARSYIITNQINSGGKDNQST